MSKTAVLAIDLSLAAEPLLQCANEARRRDVRRLAILHVLRMGYGQEPGDRALREIKDWLEGQVGRLRSTDLHIDVTKRAGA